MSDDLIKRIRHRLVELKDPNVTMVNQRLALDPTSPVLTDVPTYIHHPPLIEQLGSATARSTAGSGVPGSRPVANLAALDCLALIREEAKAWVQFQFRVTPGQLQDDLVLIYDRAATLGEEDLRQLDLEVRSWWTSARIATSWDSPPIRPHVPCPVCKMMDALRLLLDPVSVMCLECQMVWDDDDGLDGLEGLIAEAVEARAAQRETPRSPEVVALADQMV